MPDRSTLVPMTSSDLGSGARGAHFFPVFFQPNVCSYRLIYSDVIRHGNTWVRGVVLGGQPRRHPNSTGPQHLQDFGTPVCTV